jgi:hypothetical protein
MLASLSIAALMLTANAQSVDETWARVQAEVAKMSGPGQPTDLPHPQAAPPHELKQGAIPQRVNDTTKGDKLRFSYGLLPPLKATPVLSGTTGGEARPEVAETRV